MIGVSFFMAIVFFMAAGISVDANKRLVDAARTDRKRALSMYMGIALTAWLITLFWFVLFQAAYVFDKLNYMGIAAIVAMVTFMVVQWEKNYVLDDIHRSRNCVFYRPSLADSPFYGIVRGWSSPTLWAVTPFILWIVFTTTSDINRILLSVLCYMLFQVLGIMAIGYASARIRSFLQRGNKITAVCWISQIMLTGVVLSFILNFDI